MSKLQCESEKTVLKFLMVVVSLYIYSFLLCDFHNVGINFMNFSIIYIKFIGFCIIRIFVRNFYNKNLKDPLARFPMK